MSAARHDPRGAGRRRARSGCARAMSGNLCRCGAYAGIIEAVSTPRRGCAGQIPEAAHEPFDYVRADQPRRGRRGRPPTPGAAYLAGGTNLLDLMKVGVARPAAPRRHRRASRPRRHRGAAGRRAPDRRARAQQRSRADPMCAALSGGGGSAALRRLGAVAQRRHHRRQPLQRTRCAYFYDPASACNKREPGAGCDARGGENAAARGVRLERALHRHPSLRLLRGPRALDAVVEIEGAGGPARGAARGLPSAARRRAAARDRARARRADRRRAAAAGGRGLRRPCALSEGSRAHLLRLRGRLRRGHAASRGRQDRRGARGARRCRRRSPGGRARRRRCWPARSRASRPSPAPPRPLSPTRRPSGDNAYKIELARRLVVRALTRAAAGTPERRAGAARLCPSPPSLELRPCLRPPCRRTAHPSRLEQRPAADATRRPAEGHRHAPATPPTTIRPACCTR